MCERAALVEHIQIRYAIVTEYLPLERVSQMALYMWVCWVICWMMTLLLNIIFEIYAIRLSARNDNSEALQY